MKIKGDIITVGLAPAWDLTCRGSHLNWGAHPVLDEQHMVPAGKALNITRALAWLGHSSIASGWWGRDDIQQMQNHASLASQRIQLNMLPVSGRTRINVTVLDTSSHRELHMRSAATLACPMALKALQNQVNQLISDHAVCIFAGSLPELSLKNQVISLVRSCQKGPSSRLIVDASGPVFRCLVAQGLAWLIKPNVLELSELLGTTVRDRASSLVKAAHVLLDRVPNILISRGKLGAILVTRYGAWQGRCLTNARVVSTVGCGDYLLAGFVSGLIKNSKPETALANALQVATARAWGGSEQQPWAKLKSQIKVRVEPC